MKKVLALMLVLVTTLSLGACQQAPASPAAGSQPPQSSNAEPQISATPRELYFVSRITGGAAWSQAEKGFLAACDELDWNGYYLAPVERSNQTEMAALLENAITANADAIIGVFMSVEAFGPALLKAKEKDIVTASVQFALSDEYIDFQIGTDIAQQGVLFAQALADFADGKEINAVFMHTDANEVSNKQYNSVVAELEKHDNITLLDFLFDAGSAVTAAEAISDYRKAHPELNAVICGNSSSATIGVASFIEEQGLQEDWIVIGVDDSADILNYVKSQALDCTVAQDFYAMGYRSVMMINDIFNGNSTHEFYTDTGCILVLPDDIDAYAQEKGINLG